MDAASFSSVVGLQLQLLAKMIEKEPQFVYHNKDELGYLDALRAIHTITKPLFDIVATLAEDAGFEKVEPFQAWPKGLCENFVFGVVEDGKIQDVVLARNTKHGFLQCGGGKTGAHETSKEAVLREAQEEFGFRGTAEQIRTVATESASGLPVFHFVKNVYLILINRDEAENLKLADDMAENQITTLSADYFVKVAKENKEPKDHGFDHKQIAKYIMAFNSENQNAVQQFNLDQHPIAILDQREALNAYKWMLNISINKGEIDLLSELINQFTVENLGLKTKAEGVWKSEENRGYIRRSAQKVVDAIVTRLFPAWKFVGTKATEIACQVKVQDAVGVLVNGQPLPSFLTIPQMVSLQCGLSYRKFQMIAHTQYGDCRDIITRPSIPLSKY